MSSDPVVTATQAKMIHDVVFSMYMEDGKFHDVNEISEKMGRSTGWVRKYIWDAELMAVEEMRESFSRNYTSFQTGAHKVWVFAPTRSTLREVILGFRKVA